MANKESEHETTDHVAGKAHEAVDKAAETAGKAEEYAREHAAQGRQRADDMLDRVDHYVRENPLMSIGIAFVAGALYASLTRRR